MIGGKSVQPAAITALHVAAFNTETSPKLVLLEEYKVPTERSRPMDARLTPVRRVPTGWPHPVVR